MSEEEVERMIERGKEIIEAAGYPPDWWTLTDQGYSLSAVVQGEDKLWYGFRRSLGPDGIYVYETTLLGADLDTVSQATGIPVERLRMEGKR
jgi:hypothetical protein